MKRASIYDDLQYGEKAPAVKVLLQTETIKELRILFRAEQEMKAHQAPYPILIHTLEGSIDFGVNGEQIILHKGGLLTLEANIIQTLKALEDSIIRLTLNKFDQTQRVERVVR